MEISGDRHKYFEDLMPFIFDYTLFFYFLGIVCIWKVLTEKKIKILSILMINVASFGSCAALRRPGPQSVGPVPRSLGPVPEKPILWARSQRI